jgi:O-methyltransferase
MMQLIIRRSWRVAGKLVAYWKYYRVFRKFNTFTMIPVTSYVRNLAVVEKYSSVRGVVIECGVWKGGMIAGIANILGPEREYYLFDSFEGLPEAKGIDGEAALKWQANKTSPNYYDNCKAAITFAQEAMRLAGVTRFHAIQGFFEESLPSFTPNQPIAILRLDADWYESTMTCLRHLYPFVADGGLIILDDYYTWDGCSRALHDFLAQTTSAERVRQYDNDVCFIIKKPAKNRLAIQVREEQWRASADPVLDGCVTGQSQ